MLRIVTRREQVLLVQWNLDIASCKIVCNVDVALVCVPNVLSTRITEWEE